MRSQIACLPSPSRVSADDLRRSVAARIGTDLVRGAFPVVMARSWRHRLAELTGTRRLIPGKPLIAAAVGEELWLFSSSVRLEVGALLAVVPSDSVTPVDRVDHPQFECGSHRLQLTVDWFDEARIALARIRRPRR